MLGASHRRERPFRLPLTLTGMCSFGELFNSRLGDQGAIATIKDDKPLSPDDGFAMSVTGEDSMGGRSVKRIAKIEVY